MKSWPIINGVLAYLIFCVAAWEIYRDPVDEKLGQKAVEALAETRLADNSAGEVTVDYRGMRGTLRGVGGAELAERLRREIGDAVGWGSLEVEIGGSPIGEAPEEAPILAEAEVKPSQVLREPTFAMRPGAEPGTVVMWGELPDDDLIDALVLGTRSDQPSVRWVDAEQLRRADVKELEWCERLPSFVNLLISQAGRASLQSDAEGFVVGGDVGRDEEKSQILESAKELAGGEVIDQIRVPGTLEISRNEKGVLSIGGRVGSDADGRVFSEALAREIPGAEIEIAVEVTPEVYCPDWMLGAADTLAKLVGERPRGAVRIGSGKLVVGGGVGGDDESHALLTMAGEVAGDLLTVESDLKVLGIPKLSVVKIGAQVMLEGLLPTEEFAGQLIAGIQGRFPLGPDVDREGLQVSDGVGASPWFPRAVASVPGMLEAMDAGQIDISSEGLTVFAGVRSPEAREELLALSGNVAGGQFPLGDVDIIVLKSPKLGVVLSGNTVTLTGRLPSDEHRETVEARIQSILSTVDIDNSIEVDEDVWDPEWLEPAGDAIPEFLQIASDLGGAQVEIDGEKVTAAARLSSDELQEPIGLLFSPLGRAGLKVDLKLEVLAQPRLIVSHSGGKTKLGGRLNSIETKTKFAHAVAAAHRGLEIEDTVVIDPGVAESGWDAMVLDLVSVVMGELKDPGFDLRPGKVRIEGEVATERARVALETKLAETFGGAFDIESAIKIPEEAMVAEPRFELAEREGKWALAGMVSTEDEKAELMKVVEAVKPKADLIDEVEVTTEVGASPWISELGPVISILGRAKDPWVSVFQGTVTVEGEFAEASEKQLLSDAGKKVSALKFEDWSTVRDAVPAVVIPPPPDGEDVTERN